MGKYLEIAQKALSQTRSVCIGDRCITKDQQLKDDSNELAQSMQCEISEISELSPITNHDLKESLKDEWAEVTNDPNQLEAARYSLRTARQIAAGEIPESYTSVVECSHCGKVPAWPGYPTPTNSCPWCFNRMKDLPIPREGK